MDDVQEWEVWEVRQWESSHWRGQPHAIYKSEGTRSQASQRAASKSRALKGRRATRDIWAADLFEGDGTESVYFVLVPGGAFDATGTAALKVIAAQIGPLEPCGYPGDVAADLDEEGPYPTAEDRIGDELDDEDAIPYDRQPALPAPPAPSRLSSALMSEPDEWTFFVERDGGVSLMLDVQQVGDRFAWAVRVDLPDDPCIIVKSSILWFLPTEAIGAGLAEVAKHYELQHDERAALLALVRAFLAQTWDGVGEHEGLGVRWGQYRSLDLAARHAMLDPIPF